MDTHWTPYWTLWPVPWVTTMEGVLLYIHDGVLTLMLLVADLANTKGCKKPEKLTETLVPGYSSESTQRGLSNVY